jgi:hypothetical protein
MSLIAGVVNIVCFLQWVRLVEEKLIEMYRGNTWDRPKIIGAGSDPTLQISGWKV